MPSRRYENNSVRRFVNTLPASIVNERPSLITIDRVGCIMRKEKRKINGRARWNQICRVTWKNYQAINKNRIWLEWTLRYADDNNARISVAIKLENAPDHYDQPRNWSESLLLKRWRRRWTRGLLPYAREDRHVHAASRGKYRA
ncbi:unnamed protein product [Xylocopa violacea]|uniref:Uncharacterized protein n=1 Tax=Xylocopa violacea TaxID=135666 RepID=A0ABP1NKM3_XYLVO